MSAVKHAQKDRSAGLDLLRVICIVLIIFGHLCSQTNIDVAGTSSTDLCRGVAILFGNSERWAVNCFVMISAWFLTGRAYDNRRLVSVWTLTFLVNSIVTISVTISGRVPFSAPYFFQAFLPILGRPQWYLCEYLLLLLLSPFLNHLLGTFPRAVLRNLLAVMTIFMVGYSTLFPLSFTPPFFSEIMWFIYIYLSVGFIRREKIDLFNHRRVYWSLAVGGFSMITLAAGLGALRPEWADVRDWYVIHYEALPCLMTSVGCFFLFKNLRVRESHLLRFIAMAVGTIYILHTVPVLWRFDSWTLWNGFFHVDAECSGPWALPYLAFVVLSIITVGCIVHFLIDVFIKRVVLTASPVRRFNQWMNTCYGGTRTDTSVSC